MVPSLKATPSFSYRARNYKLMFKLMVKCKPNYKVTTNA